MMRRRSRSVLSIFNGFVIYLLPVFLLYQGGNSITSTGGDTKFFLDSTIFGVVILNEMKDLLFDFWINQTTADPSLSFRMTTDFQGLAED
jgi:hypothetical protein